MYLTTQEKYECFESCLAEATLKRLCVKKIDEFIVHHLLKTEKQKPSHSIQDICCSSVCLDNKYDFKNIICFEVRKFKKSSYLTL